jgi:nitrite reductase/ring-hydroxylating ferredoxin subunit
MPLVKACSKSEVPPGRLKMIRVGGKDIVLANVAMDNWCTHEQGNLSEGALKDSVVTCPEHGAQFYVTTGKVLIGPDQEPADSIQPEKSYKVTVQGNDVMVDIQ